MTPVNETGHNKIAGYPITYTPDVTNLSFHVQLSYNIFAN